jgi:tetratricopeptide (TPR) repeat protein
MSLEQNTSHPNEADICGHASQPIPHAKENDEILKPSPLLGQFPHYQMLSRPLLKAYNYDSIMNYCFYPSSLQKHLFLHPLFIVPYSICWMHSEVSYNTSQKRLIELLRDFERIHAKIEAEFGNNQEIFQHYQLVAHVVWRTYHQLQAKSMLQTVVRFDPNQAETHFYLAQIYQDELQDFPQAIFHFNKFIELEPNLVPANNYFLDGYFIDRHAYEPSTMEAFTNLGDIYCQQYRDYQQAKEFYNKAIRLNPNHHLAPYLQLAELLIIQEQNFSAALKAYTKARKNFITTNWEPAFYYQSCDYFPELENWIRKKYPLGFRFYDLDITVYARKFSKLARMAYQQSGDAALALTCIGNAQRIYKQHHTVPTIDLYLFQIELVLKHYRDYWQAASLCEKVIALDSTNKQVQKYLALIEAGLSGKLS